MEILNYQNQAEPTIGKDFWRGKKTKKGQTTIAQRDISHQQMEIIVQFFSSNYVHPPKTKRVSRRRKR